MEIKKCENCGSEHIHVITKEIGYSCAKCGRNTVRLNEMHQTNADKIRSMSDEELAKENIYFVSALNAKEGLHYTGLDGHYYRTAEEVVEANMKWLQSEVEEPDER